MQTLGANTIRVYHVNETADHSGCMNAFASRGIYAFIDLDSFKTYIRYVSKCDVVRDKTLMHTGRQVILDRDASLVVSCSHGQLPAV